MNFVLNEETTPMIALLVLVLCGTALIVGRIKMRRQRALAVRAAKSAKAAGERTQAQADFHAARSASDDAQDEAARLTALISSMATQQQAHLESLRSEVAALKANIDWLTGERMIDQAIEMARNGLPAEDISSDLGLSIEAAQTISTLRRH